MVYNDICEILLFKGDGILKGIFSEKNGLIRFFGFTVPSTTVFLGAFYGALNVKFFEEKTYMYLRGSEGALRGYYLLCALIAAMAVVIGFVCKRRKTELTALIAVGKGETENTVCKIIRMLGGASCA